MVIVTQVLLLAVGTSTNALYTQICQCEKFTILADTIAVQIAPDAQIGPDGIVRIQFAIAVFIDRLHGFETIEGLATVCQQGIFTEQLQATIDGAITVTIQHQQAVVGFDPAGAMFVAISVMIEQYFAVGAKGFDAVTVEI